MWSNSIKVVWLKDGEAEIQTQIRWLHRNPNLSPSGTVLVDSSLDHKDPRVHLASLPPKNLSSTLCVNPKLLA